MTKGHLLRAAFALALTLATAANAAKSLGAQAELVPQLELVHLDGDASVQLDALCAELEAFVECPISDNRTNSP